MVTRTAHAAIDLGAESGRVLVGVLDLQEAGAGVLRTHEVHRFEHASVRTPEGQYWDAPGLWREIVRGLGAAVGWSRGQGVRLRSMGVDSWGVDFALVDSDGALVEAPHCYRDEKHDAAQARVLGSVSEASLYELTGIRCMSINTLHQLRARLDVLGESVMARATSLLFIADYFHFLLSGVRRSEASIASTSEMVDRRSGGWATRMLTRVGLPTGLLEEIVPAGTVLGSVRAEVARAIGLDDGAERELVVVAPASHDTASAVAAVPRERGSSWAYLSSGTWSLMGVELPAPCVFEAARLGRFTNEVGVAGTTRFHKNIVGLWLVQECRREFARLGTPLTYQELTHAAAEAEPFRTLLDPDSAMFLQPGDMSEKIRRFARITSQPEPRTPGELVRCCLESLALGYRMTLKSLEMVTSRRIDVIHVVGGGGKNRLLNQMTADACEIPVMVGPLEATAVGNTLVQAMGLGLIPDLAALRGIVARSESTERYEPSNAEPWRRAEGRRPGRGDP